MAGFDGLTDDELERERQGLVARLDQLQRFTPGSFQEEWTRCGKQSCHCARPGDLGHGPRWSIMRYQGGRTVKRAVPAGLAQEFRDRVARWEEFEGASTWIADINHYADVWVMPVVVA